jgi:hypothetical protein
VFSREAFGASPFTILNRLHYCAVMFGCNKCGTLFAIR